MARKRKNPVSVPWWMAVGAGVAAYMWWKRKKQAGSGEQRYRKQYFGGGSDWVCRDTQTQKYVDDKLCNGAP